MDASINFAVGVFYLYRVEGEKQSARERGRAARRLAWLLPMRNFSLPDPR